VQAISWPAIVLGSEGRVIDVSQAAADLIGFKPRVIRELEERFVVLSRTGVAVPAADLPWRRAMAGVNFDEEQTWINRSSRSRLPLRVMAHPLPGMALMALESGERVIEHRSETFLRALEESLATSDSRVTLRDVLRQLAQHACDLTGARFGAIGVLGSGGAALEDFVYVGISEAEAKRIGHPPAGEGLIGAVIRERRTIRVSPIGSDPRSCGFPAHHPAMKSFLGTPLRVGHEPFGNFYLAEKEGGGEFTEDDARNLERFATHASSTVALARQGEQDHRRLFQALVHHAPHAIAFFPADSSQPAYGNPAAERMLGRIARGSEPSRSYELMSRDGRPIPASQLPSTRALAGEPVLNFEAVLVQRDERIHVLASAAPVFGDDSAVLGAVVVFQDVTAFRALDQLREEFTAVVAHDLRNPLQAMLLQVELLLRRASGETTDVPVSVLQSMMLSCERLNRLIGDLLDAARIEAGRLVVCCRPLDLKETVSSLLGEVTITLRGHPVELDVRGEPPQVLGDRPRVEQIVVNLLDNAAKYSEPGTPIRVVVRAAGEGVTLSVLDRGPGILPDEMPLLFDRYYQSRRARQMRSGVGLGLYVVKGLVEAQGGSIRAESAPGEGSAFTVWLPAATPALP
jgi:signal transduction histidine kinase